VSVNELGIARRSRRRRASLALFGRPLQRPRALPPTVELALGEDDSLADNQPGQNGDVPSVQVLASEERNQDALPAMVARVQREAGSDPRLLARSPAPELNRLIEETVRALWEESRVTAFVPLLAMRRIYEVLGLSEEPVNGDGPRHPHA
jgi:hypothetical protein